MSYANLIDPTNQTRQSKSTNCFLKKISEDGLPIKSKDAVSDTDNDKAEEANEANEKEDNLGAEFNKTPFGKKGSFNSNFSFVWILFGNFYLFFKIN